jgi:L-malate glycosyltransferase
MRILFFNYEFPPLGGGAGNASYYLLKEYAKNPELKVDFVTSSIDEKQHLLKMGDNISIYRLPIGKNPENIHYQSKGELLRYVWKTYKFSKELMDDNKYDLTHSFFTVPCGILSWLLKRKYNLPYIISLRGSDVPGYSERFAALYKFITPVIKRIWKDAYFVIANSQGLAELALKSKTEKEIGVIPNGIDIHDFSPDYSKKDPNNFTIVCVSRITPRKGIRVLIQAFKIVAGRYENVRLLIVGDGNEKSSLEQLVMGLGLKDKVTFTGPIAHEKVLPYYQKANIFALPSLNEGMSNTMLEALACGLPIITTDTGGTKELVTDNKNGFIVKMKNSYDLAEKIEKFLLDKGLDEKMGKESRTRAEELSWENVAKGYEDLYKKTAGLRKIKEGE